MYSLVYFFIFTDLCIIEQTDILSLNQYLTIISLRFLMSYSKLVPRNKAQFELAQHCTKSYMYQHTPKFDIHLSISNESQHATMHDIL